MSIDMQSLTMMLTSLLPNILILAITDMEFDALCPISGSNAIAAKDTKCVAFPNLALSTPMALMNVFPLSVFVCLKHTLTLLLILTNKLASAISSSAGNFINLQLFNLSSLSCNLYSPPPFNYIISRPASISLATCG